MTNAWVYVIKAKSKLSCLNQLNKKMNASSDSTVLRSSRCRIRNGFDSQSCQSLGDFFTTLSSFIEKLDLDILFHLGLLDPMRQRWSAWPACKNSRDVVVTLFSLRRGKKGKVEMYITCCLLGSYSLTEENNMMTYNSENNSHCRGSEIKNLETLRKRVKIATRVHNGFFF